MDFYRILLVEDCPASALMCSTMLEMSGHATTIVGNGRIAVEKVREEPFDVILMDVEMPVMGGVEATRLIRKFNSKVPIIALTSCERDQSEAQCAEAGMNGFIKKDDINGPEAINARITECISDAKKAAVRSCTKSSK